MSWTAGLGGLGLVVMWRRAQALGRSRARSRIRDVNCFLFQTDYLRPYVLVVKLHRLLATPVFAREGGRERKREAVASRNKAEETQYLSTKPKQTKILLESQPM